MSSPPAGEWSLPSITGQPPSPCSGFTLTPVGERRAALFGMSGAISDDLLIVELSRDTVVSACMHVMIIFRLGYDDSEC